MRGLWCIAGVFLMTAVHATESFVTLAPLLVERCVVCHSGPNAPLGLRLDSFQGVMAGSDRGPVVRPGDPVGSELLRRLRGDSLPRMPLTGPPYLSDADVARVTAWIASGAPRGSGEDALAAVVAVTPPRAGEEVRFSDVAPIFLQRCVKCHSQPGIMGAPPHGLRLSSLPELLQGGERVVVVPGVPQASELYRRITGRAEPRMPFDGPPFLTGEEIRLIGDWIAQGARDAEGRPSPMPVGESVRFNGELTDHWAVDDLVLNVTEITRIDKTPRIGDRVEVRGVVDADGGIRVVRLRRR